MTKKTPAIEIHDMTVSYSKKPILWGIDIHIPSQQLIAIIGPNGVGKSTLLKAIMGIIQPDSGYIKFFGKTIQQIRKNISYMPQRQDIDWQFPILVQDVVMMGRYNHIKQPQKPTKQDKLIIQQSLQQTNMLPFAKKQIGELSVGQQQKTIFARALAQQADIYLLDEPLAGVDANTSTLIFKLLKKLIQQGKTIIMIHHNLEAIQQHFDYAILLNTYIRAAGPVKDVLTPKLLKQTYSSQLNILSDISNIIQQQEIPIREK